MAFNLGRSDGDKQKTYLIDYKIYSNKSQKLWGCEDASYIHDDATCSRLAIAADSIPVTQNDRSLPVDSECSCASSVSLLWERLALLFNLFFGEFQIFFFFC